MFTLARTAIVKDVFCYIMFGLLVWIKNSGNCEWFAIRGRELMSSENGRFGASGNRTFMNFNDIILVI
jgi:hypothetical protein